MRIIEVATVLSISVLSLGAAQNVNVGEEEQRVNEVRAANTAVVIESTLNVTEPVASNREVATELSMLPHIQVAPVGAFSFSF